MNSTKGLRSKRILNATAYVLSRALCCIPIAFLIISLCLALSSCNKEEKPIVADTSPCYDITLTLDDSLSTLTAVQEVLYTNDNGCDLNSLVFHLYANAFTEYNGAIEVLSVQIDRQNVPFDVKGTIMTVEHNIRSEDIHTIRIEYKLSIPTCDARLGITSLGSINLTCFYPVLAVFENGDWRTDEYLNVGDPFFSRTSSFYVTASIPQEYTLASSGRITEEYVLDGVRTYEIAADNIRDFGMAVGKFHTADAIAKIDGASVNVRYYYIDDSNAQKSLDTAVSALQTFSAAFGNYPYSDYTVVQSGLDAGGMEYGAFVIIAPTLSQDNYLTTIIHETAHQWWYNVVGSDQLNSAWLDEGLTEFSTAYYNYLNGDRAMYRSIMNNAADSYSVFTSLPPDIGFDGTMNRHLDTYLTQGEYVAVTYLKGALLFDNLRSVIGDTKFCASLRDYYSANYHSIATQDDLIAAFERNGFQIRPIVESWTEG